MRSITYDMTGARFGFWTAISYVGHGDWFCRCDCGTERRKDGGQLRSGLSKSCGCKVDPKFIDLTGQRFGHLIVQSYEGHKRWKCLCDCGTETVVSKSNLGGATTSCGCLRGYKNPKLRNRRLVSNDQAAVHDLWVEHKRRQKKLQPQNSWDVSEVVFESLIRSPCHYCGCEPSNTTIHVYRAVGDMVGELRYNGLDRIDPTQGYLGSNVVPCCFQCNRAKGKLSYADFFAFLQRVVSKHPSNFTIYQYQQKPA